MQRAYLALIGEMDERPIDEAAVLEHTDVALSAENAVGKRRMVMLFRLRSLLTGKQLGYLASITAE